MATYGKQNLEQVFTQDITMNIYQKQSQIQSLLATELLESRIMSRKSFSQAHPLPHLKNVDSDADKEFLE